MTVRDILNESTKALEAVDIPSARLKFHAYLREFIQLFLYISAFFGIA